MDDIRLTCNDVEKIAVRALGVPSVFDLGVAPNGGRYYSELLEGLSQILSSPDLDLVIKSALSDYLLDHRSELRAGLARWLRELRHYAE